MKSVVIGGTAGVGREIAMTLAAKGHSLLITGKDLADVEACTVDMHLRYGVEVQGIAVDASNSIIFIRELEKAATDFGKINYLFLAVGASNDADEGDLEIEKVNEILSSNFLVIIMAMQIFRSKFVETERAGVIGFSSVAAIRGRNKNVIYTASKRALESYFESLRMIFYGTNVIVKYYRLGYIDTYQSYNKGLIFPKTSPKLVAQYIIRNLNASEPISYYPRYWRTVAFLIQLLPLKIFRNMAS
jgi:short-subunit dehydrogenase